MIAGRSEMRVVGVSRLANYIDTLLSRDKNLAQPFGVRGEISNYKLQNNGNVYFDLKDDRALLNCYAFAEPAAAFPPLADGALVIAYGSIGIFPKRSIYQLKVFEIVAEGGSGVLHQRYEALKKRLEAEGLFAEGRRRPLPRYPFRIALVTSPTADGARDFVTQAKARAPQVDVRRVETPVQGENAAGEIARAIGRAAAMRDVDIIVLARGGGSFEDLFAFSDERVVRALAASPIPTVSAIGHEADSPLTDFVADFRAATPSAAAQTILPLRDDLLRLIGERRIRLQRDADRAISARRQLVDHARKQLDAAGRARAGALRDRLVAVERRLAALAPAARLARQRARFEAVRERLRAAPGLDRRAQRVAQLRERLLRSDPAPRFARSARALTADGLRLGAGVARLLEQRRAALNVLAAKLEGNSPEAILQRGYAIVTDEQGRPLRDATGVQPGARITAQLARGRLSARVEAEGTDGGRQIGLF